MKLWIVPGLISLILVSGCDTEAQAGISEHGQLAGEHFSKSVSIAADSAMKKLREIDMRATPEARENAERFAEETAEKLRGIKDPTPEIQQKLRELEVKIKEFDAGAKLEGLKSPSSSDAGSVSQEDKEVENLRRLKQKLDALEKEIEEKRARIKARDREKI